MAWLQNLAGKAEDLLVKFDQNAANVFQDSNIKINEDTRYVAQYINVNIVLIIPLTADFMRIL